MDDYNNSDYNSRNSIGNHIKNNGRNSFNPSSIHNNNLYGSAPVSVGGVAGLRALRGQKDRLR